MEKAYRMRIAQILVWMLVAAWSAVIFSLSAETSSQSSQTSGAVTEVIVEMITEEPTPDLINAVGSAVREAAHFSEFLLEGLLLYAAFTLSRVQRPALFSILAGALYALSDEIHQIFVPGRAFEWFPDFTLDTLGVMLGTAFAAFVCAGIRKWRNKKRPAKAGRSGKRQAVSD